MNASDIRCHDGPPAVILKDDSAALQIAPRDKSPLRRFGIFVIRLGCKISGIDFLDKE